MSGNETAGDAGSSTVVETGTGTSTSFEFTNDPNTGAPTVDRLVPSEYQGKPWVENLKGKPVNELFKKVDNLESMIGQRQTFTYPAADAPPEQVQAFRKQLNIPESPDKYVYQPPSGDEKTGAVWAEMAKNRNLSEWQKVAHEAHLTPQQFQKLVQEQETRLVQQFIAHQEAEQQAQQEHMQEEARVFDELATQAFGTEKERALDTAKRVLIATCPNSVKPFIARLSPESLIVLSAYIHAAHKEDGFVTTGAGGGQAPLSEAQIEEQGMAYQKELRDLLNKGVQGPKIRELEQKVKDTYALLRKRT